MPSHTIYCNIQVVHFFLKQFLFIFYTQLKILFGNFPVNFVLETVNKFIWDCILNQRRKSILSQVIVCATKIFNQRNGNVWSLNFLGENFCEAIQNASKFYKKRYNSKCLIGISHIKRETIQYSS